MTVAPHPRSVLAVACWLQEFFEQIDWAMREYHPRECPPVSNDEAADRLLAYYAAAASDRHTLFTSIAQAQLTSFVPARYLANDDGAVFIDQFARLMSSALKPCREPRSASAHSSPDEWRPHRYIQAEIIAGAYFSLRQEERSAAATADLLNRGIPTGDHRLDDGHVRNALKTFSRQSFRVGVDQLEFLCSGLVLSWRTLDRIWDLAKAHLRPQPISLGAIMDLSGTGLLFIWRREAELEAATLPFNMASDVAAIDWRIKELKDLQRRKVARPAF